MSVRPLSSALQQKAEVEVNEVPSRIREDLQHMKEWFAKQPHLNVRTDDQWILGFLRGCKFSLERTKEKMDAYYTLKSLVPEFFRDTDPFLREIQEFLEHGIMAVLPKTADPAGPRVVMISAKSANSDIVTVATLIKLIGMMGEILLMEDDNFTIAGFHAIVDMQNTDFRYLKQITPSFLKKLATCMQKGSPTRIKGVHFLNMSPIFSTAYTVFNKLSSEKLSKRLTVYTDENMDTLYKIISPSILPKEYGGEDRCLKELSAEWKHKVESYRNWFVEDAAYGSDETKRPGKPLTSADMFGIEGSFRKLNID